MRAEFGDKQLVLCVIIHTNQFVYKRLYKQTTFLNPVFRNGVSAQIKGQNQTNGAKTFIPG